MVERQRIADVLLASDVADKLRPRYPFPAPRGYYFGPTVIPPMETMQAELINLKPGEIKLIRVDGTEETEFVAGGRHILDSAHRMIGCSCVDTVIVDRKRHIVMLCDDTGMVDGKPVNPRATELYHAVTKPGNPYSIHGDVVLAFDRDFR